MERRTNAEVLVNGASEPSPAESGIRAWRFDGFEFDLRRGELTGPDSRVIPLRPKAEVLLRRFLERPGELIAREALMAAIWPDVVVTDDSLVQCVRELRAALGERGNALIHTVPRRGYRFDALVTSPGAAPLGVPIAEPATATARPANRRRWLGFGLLAVLVLLTAAAGVWLGSTRRPGIDAQVGDRHVFAVMPFEADEPALGPVADRIADHVAAQLATRPGTRCIGPARTRAFQSASLAALAERTGATYLMTGRVGRSAAGQAVRVEVQLIATPGGELVGAERFDLGSGADAGAEMGQMVMNFMRGRVGALDDASALREGHTPTGSDLVLLGWNEILLRQSPSDMSLARERFEAALREDPDSILALDGLGAVYLQQRSAGVRLRPDQVAAAEKAIDRVLRLAPNDATASLLWGNLQLLEGRPELALPAIEKANRITPGFPNGHLLLARALLGTGRIGEASPQAQRAVRLANLSRDTARASAALQLDAEVALMQGEDERALELARRAVGERPANGQAHAVLAAAEMLSGHADAAQAELLRVRKLAPALTVANFDITRPSSDPRYLGARARLYDALIAAGMPER